MLFQSFRHRVELQSWHQQLQYLGITEVMVLLALVHNSCKLLDSESHYFRLVLRIQETAEVKNLIESNRRKPNMLKVLHDLLRV